MTRDPVMKRLLVLIVILNALSTWTDKFCFRRQSGTYSQTNLCKRGAPIFKYETECEIECFALCQRVLGGSCKSFKYQRDEKLCSLYQDVIRGDFNECVDGSCIGYQMMPHCPVGFKYFMESNKCLKMQIGRWNWSEAMNQCNKLHPQSHLVIVDTVGDWMSFYIYVKAEIVPKCPHPLDSRFHGYWTSGIGFCVNGNRQPFQWQPFPGVVKPTTASIPWHPGQPNFPAGNDPNCIASYVETLLDDSKCVYELCALCEIDMP